MRPVGLGAAVVRRLRCRLCYGSRLLREEWAELQRGDDFVHRGEDILDTRRCAAGEELKRIFVPDGSALPRRRHNSRVGLCAPDRLEKPLQRFGLWTLRPQLPTKREGAPPLASLPRGRRERGICSIAQAL